MNFGVANVGVDEVKSILFELLDNLEALECFFVKSVLYHCA